MDIYDELAEAVLNVYTRRFPAVRQLSNRASGLAKRRGYVRTGLGRRRRFGKDESTHAALNAVIQGTAADVMKLKLLEAYRHRKELGLTLRFTVHDELDGDLDPDPRAVAKLKALLDEPTVLNMKVPIRWEVKTGPSWGEAK